MSKIKALLEKRNTLLNELDTIATAVETEVRGFTDVEDSRVAELKVEVEKLDKAIKFAEERSKDVQIIEENEEARSVDKTQDLQYEVRAVEQFLRRQDGEEIRAVQTSATPGSLTVPVNLSNLIVEKLFEVAQIFSRTRHFTPVNGTLEVLREQTLGTAGFIGEMTPFVANDFTMDKVTLRQKRGGTAIELSQHLINDSGIDIVNYAIGLLGRRLAITLDKNVIDGTGDGNNQFEGMLGAAGQAGGINFVTGKTIAALDIEDFIDVYNAMNPEYQAGAVWVMHRNIFNILAKFKDGTNNFYLIRDVAAAGAGYRLLGLPVLITEAMPATVATGGYPVLLANFGQAYATMIKKGLNLQHISGDTTQALRGSHLLLLDGYFDGKILNPDAAKFLKVK